VTEENHLSAEDAQRRSWARLRRGIIRKRDNEAVRRWEEIDARWEEIDINNHLAEAVRETWIRPGLERS
jgi:hypothetical protein